MNSETLTEQDLLVMHKSTVLPAGTAAPDFTLKSTPDETVKRVDAKASALLGISFNTPTNTPIANALTTGIIELPETFRNFDWQTEAARGDTKKGQELFATPAAPSATKSNQVIKAEAARASRAPAADSTW